MLLLYVPAALLAVVGAAYAYAWRIGSTPKTPSGTETDVDSVSQTLSQEAMEPQPRELDASSSVA